MPSVLVVDADRGVRDLASVYLRAAGFVVTCADDGLAALEIFHAEQPDIVVLDTMLPGMGGTEVCSAIRASGSTPVIMFSARDTDDDKVALLEAGCDDYLVKPFDPAELVTRVRGVLRRFRPESEPPHERLTLGGLVIEPETREVTLDGTAVELTAREFDLLCVMAVRPGVVFSREQLLERSVGYADFVDVRGVDVHVRHLRKKLGDNASRPRFVETVRGEGYRIRSDQK